MSATIQLRRGTAASAAASNPVLALAEVGLETDTGQFKVGNGVTPWNSLPYGGIVGPQGAQGAAGAQGATGAQGPSGATGPAGPQGPNGADGAAGAQGPQGNVGTTGSQGPQGNVGATGSQGPQGSPGTTGSPGADGKTVRSGSGAPSGGLGVDGDWYINTVANTIYGPKASGTWGSPVSLVGPQGNTGSQGIQGIQGIQGVQGPAGNGGPSTCRAIADTANSSNTTPSDIAGLSFALTAGVTYAFEFRVIFQSVVNTTGIALSVTFPAMTVFTARAEIPIAADGAAGDFQGWITASDDLVIGTGVQTAAVNYLAIIRGQCTPSANGTLQARVRSEISASAVTVKAGSCGLLQVIP